jgi:hypothetical protein
VEPTENKVGGTKTSSWKEFIRDIPSLAEERDRCLWEAEIGEPCDKCICIYQKESWGFRFLFWNCPKHR